MSAQQALLELRVMAAGLREYKGAAPPQAVHSVGAEIKRLADLLEGEVQANTRLLQWINDLQSGMWVNCVYCGFRYGPGETTPVSMADALKAHIEVCPEHPLAKLRAEHAALTDAYGAAVMRLQELGEKTAPLMK